MRFMKRLRNRIFDIRERMPEKLSDDSKEEASVAGATTEDERSEEATVEEEVPLDKQDANEETDNLPEEETAPEDTSFPHDEAQGTQKELTEGSSLPDDDVTPSDADVAQEAIDAIRPIWEADDAAYLASGATSGDSESNEPDDTDGPAVSFRDGDNIEPLGFDAPFKAEHAVGEMLTDWHLRLVYDHDMPEGDDEPIVELYDAETGEFVSDYWVSTFCDNSEEREGQGLACKGAVKRFRIMYEDLVGMQGMAKGFAPVVEWFDAHEGDMPNHDI